MPGGLPPVLITNTETITEEIDNSDRVRVEDVARLWRVYTLNSTHIEDDEGVRLENFFWRIWSNRNIIRSIRGNTLARLFITISEGGNRVRTTPVPSPLGTTPTQNMTFPLTESKRPKVSSSSTGVATCPCRTSDQSRTPLSILKRSRTGSDVPPKSAKISSRDAQVQEPITSAVRRQPPESTEGPSQPSPAAEKGLKNAGKKRTSFAATAGTRKAQPGVTRKRSSQSSASSEQKKGSQTSPSPRTTSAKPNRKAIGGLPAALAAATFALPSSSWQDVDSPASSRNSLDSTFSTSQQPSSWLVDKNFRGKFVENQKRATSSINLSDLGKSQSVRFLDELSEHQRAAGKGETRTVEMPRHVPDMVGRSEPRPASTASRATEEAADDDTPALPRTKSQLSMLINKERKHSGNADLGPKSSTQENQRTNDKGNIEDYEEEENELLLMARRDKKGKAKDPDQPFRAAARKGFRRDSSDDGNGPRSPPPVF